MKVEQIYTGCLAQGAYYIESSGEAVVIDPLREVGAYIQKALKDGARIKYVLETHFHADFVSGHLDLAQKTGATIVYGPTASTSRSKIFISTLRARGYDRLIGIKGGFKAIKEAGIPVTDYVCPTTLTK